MVTGRIRMRHLRCFRMVADLGSVTLAARALGTVQPSVSRTIKELEEELGQPLFHRGATGLDLTQAGRTLLAYVSNGLGQIDHGVEALRGQMPDRRVVAYVLPNVVRMIMPGAVQRFKVHCPDVDLTLMPAVGGGLARLLRDGDVDFGFGRLLAVDEMAAMNFEHLFSEPLVFFVRAGHPLATHPAPDVEDIDRFAVVLPNPGTIIRTELDRFLIARGMERFRNVVETISFEFMRSYIASSDAVALQPRGAMRRELSEGRVVELALGSNDLMGSVGITTPAGKAVSVSAALLIQMIREEVAAQGLA